MASAETRLGVRVWAVVGVLVLVGGGLWWWRHDRAVATVAARTPPPGGSGGRLAVARPATVEPARIAVTVTDEHGPIADATVRLAPRDGDVVVVKTGRDGVARADRLEPGPWKVSASATEHVPAARPAELAAGIETTLAIALVSGGRTLRGTVSDATGGPIAGARIDAARLTAAAQPGDAISTTVTGADGTYRLSVAPGVLRVAASSADYAPQARPVEVGAAGAVADFALVPGGVIEGVVRDDRTQQPVPGARVVARRDNPMMLAETGASQVNAGADGRFRLGGLRPGVWSVSASADARFSRAPASVGIGVAEQIADLELWIGAGPTIRGKVVDDTGAPAGDVEVRAFTRGAFATAKADATGAFVIERLGPGDYAVTARGPRYLPAGATRVALTNHDVDHVVVTVRRAIALTGHVEPRQACEVTQAPDDRRAMQPLPLPSAATGPDGAFTIGPVAEGPTRLIARCAGGDQGALQVTVARGMAEVILPVRPGASIAGHVVDGDGKPVAGAGVIASEISHGEHTTIANGVITSGAQALSDATGAYVLDGLAPGTYQLGALDRGMPMHADKAPRVELAANERKTGADLVIDRPTGVISGTVTGADGKPLTDAWVSVQLDVMAMMMERSHRSEGGSTVFAGAGDGASDTGIPPVLTDAQGHYEVRNLPHAIFGVSAEAMHGQLRAHADRVEPDATVDLRVLGVAVLSGTVTGASGPTALFSVELAGPTVDTRSFTDGRFSFGRVDPGAYTVRVEAAEGNAEAKLVVKPGEPASVALTLNTNAIVIGTLVDAAGKPLADVPVVLAPDEEGHQSLMINGPPVTTGPDGRFRLEHRAERSALIVLTQQSTGRPFSRHGLMLEAGKTLDLGVVTVTAGAGPGPGPGTGPGPGPGPGPGSSAGSSTP